MGPRSDNRLCTPLGESPALELQWVHGRTTVVMLAPGCVLDSKFEVN